MIAMILPQQTVWERWEIHSSINDGAQELRGNERS